MSGLLERLPPQARPAASLRHPAVPGISTHGMWCEWLPFFAAVSVRLFCLRDFMASPFFAPLGGDRGLYQRAAGAVCQGAGWPDVFSFMPLYPYLLGWFYRLVGGPNLAAAAILNSVLDGLTALLIARLARRRYGAPAGALAGLGFALLGPAVAYSLVTMPTALGLFWTALTANCVASWRQSWNHVRAMGLGLLVGAGGLLLGACWLMLLPFALWIGLEPRSRIRRRLTMGLLCLFCGAMCLLPSLAHNLLRGGQWIPLTAHGGLNFFMGNNPSCAGYGTALPGTRASAEEMTRDAAALASRLTGRPLNAAQADRYWKQRAWEFWRETPAAALSVQAKKILRLVSVREFDDTGIVRLLPEAVRGLRWAPVGFGLIWILACAGYGLRPARSGNPGLWIMAGCVVAGMLLTFVTTRYRLPLAVLLLPAASATLAQLPAIARNARRGINLRWLAGLAGAAMAFAPGVMPDTSLVDDLARAGHWIQQGNSQAAMPYALQAARRRPTSDEAWFVLGNASIAQSNHGMALHAYARATRLRPDRTDVLFNAGRALESMGNPDAARGLYEHIVELEPDNAKAWFSLAVVARQAGEWEPACEALIEAAGLAGWNHPEIAALWRELN